MKIKSNPKYNMIAAYAVGVFALCLALVAIIFKYSSFSKYVAIIADVFAPILWGIVIAYLLNPIMMAIEKYLGKLINRRKPHPKILRAISVIISLALFLGVIIALIANIIPTIFDSVKSIFGNLDTYLNNAEQWVNKLIEENELLSNMVAGEFVSVKKYIIDFATSLEQKMDILNTIAAQGISILGTLKDLLLGLILAVYMLLSKETFLGQSKKVLYAVMPFEKCNKTLVILRRVNYIFSHSLSGKALDSLIIGLLTFAVLTFADFPYVVLISLIIGITNMIPFFGPFIGAIPCGFIVFFAEPDKTIFFAVFILILQQFDGNFLGPTILGDTLGISAFWIMVAILIGGGLFGFAGMVFAVPVFGVFYTLFKDLIENRLKKKELPVESEHYRTTECIQPEAALAEGVQINSNAERVDTPDDNTRASEADSENKKRK